MFTEALLSKVWEQARDEVLRVRGRGQSLQAASLAGSTPRTDYIAYMAQLNVAASKLNAARSTPGIVAYVRNQLDNQALDVDGILSTAGTACATLRDWIFTNFPQNGGGGWLVFSYDSAGVQTTLLFTTGQLAGFRTNVDTLLAATS